MLFTFPSRYCFTIGSLQCLALDHGRPRFNRNFTCSGLLRYLLTVHNFSRTGLSPSSVSFPKTIPLNHDFFTAQNSCNCPLKTLQPHIHNAYRLTCIWFRLLPFRSPLLRVSLRFLLLRLLRCFTSPTLPPLQQVIALRLLGCPIRISTDR